MDKQDRIAWLVAYAVGLAYSPQPTVESVHQLQAAAGGHPELLDVARHRLADLNAVEPDIARRAATFLAVAAGSVAALG